MRLRSPRSAKPASADWDPHDIVALLKTGRSPRGSVMGPMADVVFRSTQYLDEADLHAMAVYLKALPDADAAAAAAPARPVAPRRPRDGARREDLRPALRLLPRRRGPGRQGAYPPLAGNRAVLMDSTGQPDPDRAPRRLPALHRAAIRAPTACRPSARCWTTATSRPCSPTCAAPGATTRRRSPPRDIDASLMPARRRPLDSP